MSAACSLPEAPSLPTDTEGSLTTRAGREGSGLGFEGLGLGFEGSREREREGYCWLTPCSSPAAHRYLGEPKHQGRGERVQGLGLEGSRK